jgi:hypothetical protein
MSWLSSSSIYERRRLVLAIVTTVVLIPVAWWTQRSPNSGAARTPSTEFVASQDLSPGFLTGSKQTIPHTTQPLSAAAAADSLIRSGMATYKNFGVKPVRIPGSTTMPTLVPTTVLPRDVCILNFLPEGTPVVIENTDNGRTVSCHVRWQTIPPGMLVVLNTPLFQRISELGQAPIPVLISW